MRGPEQATLRAAVALGHALRQAGLAVCVEDELVFVRALGELDVRGVPTTRELAIDVLRSEEFEDGRYSTSYLEQAEGRLPALAPK